MVGGGGEEEEAERSREEMIEERKDQFFKFVDLPSGKRVMVFKYKDRFYASNALCPHRGAELYLGDVEEIRDEDMGIVWGHSITCPLHNWVFNLEDGTCDKKRYVLDVYEVKNEAGQIYITSRPKNQSALAAAAAQPVAPRTPPPPRPDAAASTAQPPPATAQPPPNSQDQDDARQGKKEEKNPPEPPSGPQSNKVQFELLCWSCA